MKPKIGNIVKGYYFGPARIIAIHPFGTIDVEAIASGRCYRITGLRFDPKPAPCSPLDVGPL